MNLTVGRVLIEALEEIRRNGRSLLLALSAPAVVIAVLNITMMQAEQPGSGMNFLFLLLGVFLYALFAVSCHRIILLGPDRLPNPWGIYASKEVWQYAGTVVGFVLLGIVAGMLVVPFVAPILTLFDQGTAQAVMWMIMAGALLLILLVSARVILFFPALAVGDGRTLADILDLSKPTWPRLALLIGVSAILTGVLSWPLDAMSRAAGSTALAALPAFVSCLIGAYGVAVISCAYRAHVESEDSHQGETAQA